MTYVSVSVCLPKPEGRLFLGNCLARYVMIRVRLLVVCCFSAQSGFEVRPTVCWCVLIWLLMDVL